MLQSNAIRPTIAVSGLASLLANVNASSQPSPLFNIWKQPCRAGTTKYDPGNPFVAPRTRDPSALHLSDMKPISTARILETVVMWQVVYGRGRGDHEKHRARVCKQPNFESDVVDMLDFGAVVQQLERRFVYIFFCEYFMRLSRFLQVEITTI